MQRMWPYGVEGIGAKVSELAVSGYLQDVTQTGHHLTYGSFLMYSIGINMPQTPGHIEHNHLVKVSAELLSNDGAHIRQHSLLVLQRHKRYAPPIRHPAK